MTAALDAARASGLLAPAAPVVVLLSGGRDSVCLLDIAAQLAGREAVSALHVDYGLRSASARDAEHCRGLAARLGVPLDVRAAGPPPAVGNLHDWAREVRYAAAREHAAARGAAIATGHTRTDQVETVLYRLAASPGRRALLGMAPHRDGIVRPLLGVTREQTAAHCRERGLDWCEDALNDDPRYARARVRNELVPALRTLHPAAEENVARTAAALRDEAEALDAVVDDALGGADEIALARLAALPDAIARLVVRRLAERAAGGLCPRAAGRLPELLALADGALDVGDGARAVVRGGRLAFVASEGRARPRADP